MPSKTAMFSDIALPTQPKFMFPSMHPSPIGESAPEADLGLSGSYVPGPSAEDGGSRPQSPSRWEGLESFMNIPDLLGAESGASLDDPLPHQDSNAVYTLDPPLDVNVEIEKWLAPRELS